MAMPSATHLSKSVKTTASKVAIKGTNWYLPLRKKCRKIDGLASLYPTISKTAANVANGILLSKKGMDTTQINSKMPWIIVDAFDFAPALLLADVRTTTE